MNCIDCGKEIPSFVTRCTDCFRRHNLEKAERRARIEFNLPEIDLNKTYTNLTLESPDCDE